MFTIGLTGGIGAGKSTVGELFQTLGAPLIDTDKLAHDLVQHGEPALALITEHFGPHILNDHGQLDRKHLRAVIFEFPHERVWLEECLHPLIREEIRRQLKQLNAPYCLISIPLLFETQPNPMLQHILVVDTPLQQQREQVLQRENISEQQVDQIIRRQASRRQRLAGADDVIYNNGNKVELKKQIERLHQKFQLIAKRQSDLK
ncbi:MAG: dephospho-CoA kinase [Gammaproteobacteria bacterium]|nr:dephospho-CoA kinase [Gammaproteobacteria bacterium]